MENDASKSAETGSQPYMVRSRRLELLRLAALPPQGADNLANSKSLPTFRPNSGHGKPRLPEVRLEPIERLLLGMCMLAGGHVAWWAYEKARQAHGRER